MAAIVEQKVLEQGCTNLLNPLTPFAQIYFVNIIYN